MIGDKNDGVANPKAKKKPVLFRPTSDGDVQRMLHNDMGEPNKTNKVVPSGQQKPIHEEPKKEEGLKGILEGLSKTKTSQNANSKTNTQNEGQKTTSGLADSKTTQSQTNNKTTDNKKAEEIKKLSINAPPFTPKKYSTQNQVNPQNEFQQQKYPSYQPQQQGMQNYPMKLQQSQIASQQYYPQQPYNQSQQQYGQGFGNSYMSNYYSMNNQMQPNNLQMPSSNSYMYNGMPQNINGPRNFGGNFMQPNNMGSGMQQNPAMRTMPNISMGMGGMQNMQNMPTMQMGSMTNMPYRMNPMGGVNNMNNMNNMNMLNNPKNLPQASLTSSVNISQGGYNKETQNNHNNKNTEDISIKIKNLNLNAKPYVPKYKVNQNTEEEERKKKEEEEKKKKEEEKKKKEEEERKKKEEEEKKKKEEEEKSKRKSTSKLDDLFNNSNIKSEIKDTSKVKSSSSIKKKTTNDAANKNKSSFEEKKKLLKIQEEKRKKEEEERKKKREEEEKEKKKIEKEKKEEEQKKKEEEKKVKKVERFYFIIDKEFKEGDPKIIYTREYIEVFKKWNICQQKSLLSETVIAHINELKITDQFEEDKTLLNKDKFKKSNFFQGRGPDKKSKTVSGGNLKWSGNKTSLPEATPIPEAEENDMRQWARKDLSKEYKLAEQFKQHLDEEKKKDPIKYDLTELLNVLAVDNYKDTFKKIFDILTLSTENQDKFLDVLFQKAVNEKNFVFLYARLCKDLDKDLPQKADKTIPSKGADKGKTKTKETSYMRSKLLEKCREIFKMDFRSEEVIKADNQEEHKNKVKDFILGNVNFIGELVNISLLSKKIVEQCIGNLLKKYENETKQNMKMISLEGAVILLNKFGTIVNNIQKDKIKPDDLKNFNSQIDKTLEKLKVIQEKDPLPGHLKFKIINLIEKKNDGWKETLVEKNVAAKGKDEVQKDFEESQKAKVKYGQEEVNKKIDEDVKTYRDHIEDGFNKWDYSWEIVTELYSTRGNTISEILTAFVECCFDFVLNNKNLSIANDYWNDLINYYAVRINDEEKLEIQKNTLGLLATANNLLIDNDLLIEVWANILYCFNECDIMSISQIDNILSGDFDGPTDDDIKSIFTIFKAILKVDKEKSELFKSLKLVQDNIDTYEEIMEAANDS